MSIEKIDKTKNIHITKNICETIMLKMIELLIVKINVKIFANSIVENFVINLTIELLTIKINAKIFEYSIVENFLIDLTNRSCLILILIVY